MSAFTLDTSGGVRIPHGDGSILVTWGMPHLSPFAQGYVEAALTERARTAIAASLRNPRFDMLAPATLAAMLKDCEAFQALGHWVVFNVNTGKDFWLDRQSKQLTRAAGRAFPPLALYLGDDGLIYQREAA